MQQLAPAPRPGGNTRNLLEDIHTYVDIARKGRKAIVIGVVVAMTAAVIFLARSKTVYRASAHLLIIQQAGRPIQVSRGNDPFQYQQESNESLATHLLIIRSPVVVGRAIALSDLRTVSTPSVIRNLTAKLPDDSARVIEVSYTAESRDEAARVLDGVIRSYDCFLKDNYQKSINEVIALIIKARDELNVELRSLEQQCLEYLQKSPPCDGGGRTFIARRLDQWDQTMNQMLARSLQLKSQLELGRKLAGEGVDPVTITNALNQLGVLGETAQIIPPAPDAVPVGALSSDRLGQYLADVESQRKDTEQLLPHLRREQANVAPPRDASDPEIAQAFLADPEVAAARAKLEQMRTKLRVAERLSRSPSDPAVVNLRQQIKHLEGRIQRLGEHRWPIYTALLARDPNLEIAAPVHKAEADLITLRARETTLRERLDEIASEDLQRLRQEHDQLVLLRGAEHPRVRQLGQQIAHLESTKGRSPARRPGEGRSSALLDSIAWSLEGIEVMRADVQRKYNEDMAASKEAEIGQLEEINLRDNLDRQQSLFYSVVDQLKQAQLASDFGGVSAQTINPPTVAVERPNLAFILGLALAGGCGLGMLAAVAADTLEGRVRTLSEIRRLIDLPVIGLIPQLSSDQAEVTGAVGLLSHDRPRSALAESYKSTRTNIEYLRRNRQAQVLLVSSAHPGDGKSTTASNLAITSAHAGRRVLLVDADLRRPTLHALYNLPRDRGLSDALEGGESIGSLVRPTFVKNLDLLTTGREITAPAELLASSRLGAILDEVRRDYDTVIIDSSPLLVVTDPSIIAAVADGILLVVRVASVRRQDIEQMMELLRTLGIPALGMIINGIMNDQLGYGYGYRYYYGKPYGAPVESGQERSEEAARRITIPHGVNGRAGSGHGTPGPVGPE